MKRIRFQSAPVMQRGLTLIELLVALTVSTVVVVAMAAVYTVSKHGFRYQEAVGRMQEDGSYALDTMARDLRMAGFAGCVGINKTDVGGVVTRLPGSVVQTSGADVNNRNGVNPLAVFDTSAEVVVQPLTQANFVRGFDQLKTQMFAAASVPAAVPNAASIYLSNASANGMGLTAMMASSTDPLTVGAGDPFSWSGKTLFMVVSDCLHSSLFKARVSGSNITHDAVDNTSASFASNALFGSDAIVMPVVWNYYYVATRPGADTPSLYRVSFDGASRGNAQEIVGNVEFMRLQYGESTVDDASGEPVLTADTWRDKAADVADWSRVMAIRVGLMMVSEEDRSDLEQLTVTPTLLGASYTLPVGASVSRLRKEFSTTVVLRNRVAARES